MADSLSATVLDATASAGSAAATAAPTLTSAAALATSTVASWVTVSGTLPNGDVATTTAPYLGPFETLSPPLGGLVHVQKFGDHDYNFYSLTNNPFLRKTGEVRNALSPASRRRLTRT